MESEEEYSTKDGGLYLLNIVRSAVDPTKSKLYFSQELIHHANYLRSTNLPTWEAIGAKTNSIDFVWTREDSSLADIPLTMLIPSSKFDKRFTELPSLAIERQTPTTEATKLTLLMFSMPTTERGPGDNMLCEYVVYAEAEFPAVCSLLFVSRKPKWCLHQSSISQTSRVFCQKLKVFPDLTCYADVAYLFGHCRTNKLR